MFQETKIRDAAARRRERGHDSEADGLLIVRLQWLGASAWKVSDGRLLDEDARSLLGFIEKRGESFELMQVGATFSWLVFGSLTEALWQVMRSGEGSADDRQRGELAWISAATTSSHPSLPHPSSSF
jgi:hypothetical protein